MRVQHPCARCRGVDEYSAVSHPHRRDVQPSGSQGLLRLVRELSPRRDGAEHRNHVVEGTRGHAIAGIIFRCTACLPFRSPPEFNTGWEEGALKKGTDEMIALQH